MSLRARLAWMYGIAVFVAVVLLALIALTAIDRSLRSSLDGRLKTAAAAGKALVDVHDGRLDLDREDRAHFIDALGGAMDAAVFAETGRVYTTSSAMVPPEVGRVATQKPGAAAFYSAGTGEKAIRIAVLPVERDGRLYGTVAVWQGSDAIDEFDTYAIIAMALAALLIGGIVVMLSSTLAQRALAPLERFTELATEIEAHDLSRRVGSQGGDELGRLGSAFNRMLDRLESAFTRQRRFTADASHELRAPLAVIRAEADVALGKEHSEREYRQAFKTIIEEVDRIDALVDALLLAARADSAQVRFEAVDLGEIAALTVQRFRPAAQARGVAIETYLDEEWIDGDARILERAVAAVLHNAVEFAQMSVSITLSRRDGGVVLAVEDDGPGFSAEALAHATERFWRADPARRRGGAGLGLSIVDAILRAHGGSVALANAIPRGACVLLQFPFIGASSPARTMEM